MISHCPKCGEKWRATGKPGETKTWFCRECNHIATQRVRQPTRKVYRINNGDSAIRYCSTLKEATQWCAANPGRMTSVDRVDAIRELNLLLEEE